MYVTIIISNLVFRFPSRVASNERPSVPLSHLVRKLSEVEGLMPPNFVAAAAATELDCASVDEGVEDVPTSEAMKGGAVVVAGSESAISDAGSGGASSGGRRGRLSQLASFDSASLGSCSSAAMAMQGSAGKDIFRTIFNKFIKDVSFLGVASTLKDSSSFTSSTESYPYESLDDSGLHRSANVAAAVASSQLPVGSEHADLTQSLPSCSASSIPQQISTDMSGELSLQEAASSEVVQLTARYNEQQQQQQQQAQQLQIPTQQQFLQIPNPNQFIGGGHVADSRPILRSPVHFREGRRASDGLFSQNVIAFQQKLYDKARQQHHGFELQDLQQEHRALQSQFGAMARCSTPPDSIAIGAAGGANVVRNRKGGMGTTVLANRATVSKRISVPENFSFFPGNVVAAVAATTSGVGDLQYLSAKQNVALQQQLLQHRLHQKRHQSKSPRFFPPESSASSSGSSSSNGQGSSGGGPRRMAPTRHQPGKPYLPQDALHHHQYLHGSNQQVGGDFLFQPIAEDEPGLDEIEAFMPSNTSSDPTSVSAAGAAAAATAEWQTLPSYMAETCRLGGGESGSPPPPAPPDPDTLNIELHHPRPRKASETENMDTLSPT